MEWKSIDTKIKGFGRDIIYVENKYYMVHQSPSGIAYSSDLKNWENIELDSSKVKTRHIAYGNGIFLITGLSGTTSDTFVYISKNGKNYVAKKIQTNVNFSMPVNTCKFINNMFVFITVYNYVDSAGNRIAAVSEFHVTRDGENFSKYIKRIDTKYRYHAQDVEYGNGLYVAVGNDGLIMTSTNLKDWILQNSGTNKELVGISYGKGIYVATGADGTILTSKNGVNWEKQVSHTSSYLYRSKYGNGLYLAIGYNGTILTSTNTIDWIEEKDPFKSTTISGLVFANNMYVVSAGQYTTGTIPIAYAEITRNINYTDDEALYVFDRDLNFLGVIDQFISLRWRRKYYEAGELELVVAPYENNLKLLKKDMIVMRKNYTEAAIIDTVEYNDDGNNLELSVSGKFLSYLLKRRIIRKTINFKGNVIDGQKYLLRNMTPLTENFEIEPTTIASDTIEFQCSYKNVYDYECKLSLLGNVGFRIVPNVENKTYIFENYVGIDRSKSQNLNEKYCFSKSRNNCEKYNYIDTLVNKCNYVLVGGVGDGDNRILFEVQNNNIHGFDLFETFLDAKSESNNNLSSNEYKKVLETKGREKLLDNTQNVEVTATSNDYKIKWDLGDIVDIELDNYSILEAVRIIEVEEIIENGKRTVYPTFGQPIAEKIELD